MAEDLDPRPRERVFKFAVPDFGYTFLTIGGGVERFLSLGFSKVDAMVLNAGDRP